MPEPAKASKKSYSIIREGSEDILKLDYESVPFSPSIEDSSVCMADVIEKLSENPSVSGVVFSQRRNYAYDTDQVRMLVEIALIYSQLVKRKSALGMDAMGAGGESEEVLAYRYSVVHGIVFDLLKSDPLGAYVDLKRRIRTENALQKQATDVSLVESSKVFLSVLTGVYDLLDKTKIVTFAKPYLAGYQIGDRSVYRSIFRPAITPDFMFTKLLANPPAGGKQLSVYQVGGADITIYSVPDDVKYMYHITPPEFKLTEDKYALVTLAKSVLAEHQPKEEEFLNPDKLRVTFSNIGSDLLRELAEHQGIDLSNEEVKELTEILVRNTIGFGMIELLLADDRIQDITINSPMGQVPIFILHSDFNECYTNITPATSDFESWGSKFRLLSGRPLDEANPILDTELSIPGARSRVSIINRPLNPYGLAFAFRRHRDKPWTLPLLVKFKMLNPLAAGLISFLIQGSRTMLVAGTRSSGKTSLLGACLLEIMRKYRIITIEDSVTGDTELVSYTGEAGHNISTFEWLFKTREAKKKRIAGREIIDNPGFKVFAMDKNGNVKLRRVTKMIRHKVNKPIYEIVTATGRTIKVTGDHSLFKLGESVIKEEVKASEIKEGDFLLTPRVLPFETKKRRHYDLRRNLIKFHLDKKIFVSGENFSIVLAGRRKKIKESFRKFGYSKITASSWIRRGILPLKVAYEVGVMNNVNRFKLSGNSEYVPIRIQLDDAFLMFAGLWTADGCYDRNSVIMSVSSKEERELVGKIAKRFGFTEKLHSDKFSLMINSKSLKFAMQQLMHFDGNAYTKHIPCWIFNLTRKQTSSFLRGLFSGDGCVSDKEVIISLASRKLLSDIQTLLLGYGIILRINALRKSKFNPNDRTIDGRVSVVKYLKRFKEVGFLQKYKRDRLFKLVKRVSTHDTSDVIPLSRAVKEKIATILVQKQFNAYNYFKQKSNIGREKLKEIVNHLLKKKNPDMGLVSYLKNLSESDIFWDKVVMVRNIKKPQYVYDLSVLGYENFVCNNILAHNTLELNVDAMRELGYNIQPMKVRSALTKGGTELDASEGIRTSLRLGDSALIVGEVRSQEAVALYEAMRIGALANVVAGTIHGDSPYGVFDRVVNDIGVPRTSFKATDIIIVANPLKSPDGMHKWRRVTQITEVRKTWEEDPLAERGFVDLMKYNASTDQLEPTGDLMNGESEVLKSIGANVKEWTGNWDAIWNNILMRAKVTETLVRYAGQVKDDGMLEAKFVLDSNDRVQRFSEKVREEFGELDNDKIFERWEEWLKKVIRDKNY